MTLMSPGAWSSVQWAALSTHLVLTREPPQKMEQAPGLEQDQDPTSPACQGYAFTSVLTPPTILVALLTRPQVQLAVFPT